MDGVRGFSLEEIDQGQTEAERATLPDCDEVLLAKPQLLSLSERSIRLQMKSNVLLIGKMLIHCLTPKR